MDIIDYMDRVLQVTQLSVCVLEFTANVFGKMPQMSSARIENGCESSIMMYIYFFKRLMIKMNYIERICDSELQDKLDAFGAVHVIGPKWCGKTTTAKQFAKSYIEMQDPDMRDSYIQTAQIKPSNLLVGENPRLIDEWQIAPNLWDAVRVSVDKRNESDLYIFLPVQIPLIRPQLCIPVPEGLIHYRCIP